MVTLSGTQQDRYSRHIMLSEIGEHGQKKLLDASVLIVGLGGLGSPVAYYLAAAGIGHLGIIDPDVVDISNLQRQIAHSESDCGRNKVDSVADSVTALNSTVVPSFPKAMPWPPALFPPTMRRSKTRPICSR